MSATRTVLSQAMARPGELLLHPVAIGALVVLVLNDHVLKAQHAGLVTGKLSDVAGLVLLPLLLHGIWVAIVRVVGPPTVRASWTALWAACLASGLVFVLIKVTTIGNETYRVTLGALQWPWHAAVSVTAGTSLPPLRPAELIMDPWDLVALAALVVPLILAAPQLTRCSR